jgi:UDP-N-acetyl-D-mannosaminuronic acid dehydrogenase
VERQLAARGLAVDVAFCPERIAEGKAMDELRTLPQIIGARSETARARARALFATLTDTLIDTTPEEAELAKLFTNTWRYIKFAAANQFMMIANDHGLDFERIRHAITHDYPRAADLPGAGFAAGPCLFKDTMQLAAFNGNSFQLGHAAMFVNEGLPLYVVSQLEREHDLATMTVGILGMSFKAESDDIRSSLSYKLKRILRFKAQRVLCTDPYVDARTDNSLVPLAEVLAQADVLVIGAPHPEYRELATEKPVADVWGITGRGLLP